jgi:hypothetical protein
MTFIYIPKVLFLFAADASSLSSLFAVLKRRAALNFPWLLHFRLTFNGSFGSLSLLLTSFGGACDIVEDGDVMGER